MEENFEMSSVILDTGAAGYQVAVGYAAGGDQIVAALRWKGSGWTRIPEPFQKDFLSKAESLKRSPTPASLPSALAKRPPSSFGVRDPQVLSFVRGRGLEEAYHCFVTAFESKGLVPEGRYSERADKGKVRPHRIIKWFPVAANGQWCYALDLLEKEHFTLYIPKETSKRRGFKKLLMGHSGFRGEDKDGEIHLHIDSLSQARDFVNIL